MSHENIVKDNSTGVSNPYVCLHLMTLICLTPPFFPYIPHCHCFPPLSFFLSRHPLYHPSSSHYMLNFTPSNFIKYNKLVEFILIIDLLVKHTITPKYYDKHNEATKTNQMIDMLDYVDITG